MLLFYTQNVRKMDVTLLLMAYQNYFMELYVLYLLIILEAWHLVGLRRAAARLIGLVDTVWQLRQLQDQRYESCMVANRYQLCRYFLS